MVSSVSTRSLWLTVLAGLAVVHIAALATLPARDTAAELPDGYQLGEVMVVDAGGTMRSLGAANLLGLRPGCLGPDPGGP